MSENTAEKKSSTTSGKKKRSLPILLAIVLVPVVAGAGGLVWWTSGDAGAGSVETQTDAASHETAPAELHGVVALAPFVVNLADPGGTSFLRASISVLVAEEREAEEIAEDAVSLTRLRAAILEVLSHQTADHLLTPAGKTELETAISEPVGEILAGVHVGHVLFTEFVIQR